MLILKKGHQPGVYVPLRALFLVIFYFTANASSLLILFKYARVETTCHFLSLFSGISVFWVFDCEFPFGIGSSVWYFTFLAQSEMPRPIKILICRIGRGVPNDFDIVYKKQTNWATWWPSLSKEKSTKSWN